MIGFAVSPEKIIYVCATGDDGDDGSTWALAKATVPGAIAIATGGEVIALGDGTFAGAGDASAIEGLDFIGSGPGTILTHDGQQTLQLAKNSSVRRMQIANTLSPCPPNAYCIDIAAGGDDVLIEDVVFTSVDYGIRAANCDGLRVRRCTFYCPEYAVYAASTSPAGRTIVENCISYATGWTSCNAGSMMFMGPAILRNSLIVVESANVSADYAAIPVTLYSTSAHRQNVLIDNCLLHAIGTNQANAYGVYVQEAVAGNIVTILNSTILTSSANGNAYDLYNFDGDGILAVGNTKYDRTKVQGTITVVPPTQVTSGPGGTIFTHTVEDGASQPIAGVQVWVTTDQAGTKVEAGPLTTDGNGQAVFVVKPGDYYLWKLLPGWNPDANPEAITVT